MRADRFEWGRGRMADFFLRPPTLTDSNFAALSPTDPKFSALKDLITFLTVSKVQEAGSILKVGFALSKGPHLHRAYLVTVYNQNFIAVYAISNQNLRVSSPPRVGPKQLCALAHLGSSRAAGTS